MQRKHVYSTLVPDTLAMIAACTNSRPMMELAVALRAVVSGVVLLPPDRLETISRITRDLTNPQWNLQAHITLRDPMVGYWAKMFWRACIQAVPLTAENPTRDLVWQGRLKAELERNSSLQNHAKLLLQQIRLRVTPAQPVVAPVIATTPTTAPQSDKAEVHTLSKEAQKAQATEKLSQRVRKVPRRFNCRQLCIAKTACQFFRNPYETPEQLRSRVSGRRFETSGVGCERLGSHVADLRPNHASSFARLSYRNFPPQHNVHPRRIARANHSQPCAKRNLPKVSHAC